MNATFEAKADLNPKKYVTKLVGILYNLNFNAHVSKAEIYHRFAKKFISKVIILSR